MDVTSKEWKSLFAIHPYHISQEEWEKMCNIDPFLAKNGFRETPDPEASERLLDLLHVYNEYHNDVYFPMVHPLECQSITFLTSREVPFDLNAYILEMLDADPSTIQYIDVWKIPREFWKKMAHVVLRRTSDAFSVVHGKPWEMDVQDLDEDEMRNPLCHFKMLLNDKEFVLNLEGEYYTLNAILDHCPLLFDPDVCAMWLGCWDDNEFYLVAGYLNIQKKCPPMDAETCKHYLDGLEEGCDDYDHAKQLLRERLAEIV
jgi:hypothetical protein